ncbi:MAG TPA: hypothetical protein VHE34_12405 [Puia sp.]|uniref:hypothetical protein n=1 Tax=Puia sp. TaxID=2045100 RepID=UPI002C2307FE|nr:hypothetical protein [Puia sp.]HVU96024.1 hypothetical protein [Puia sp.]
MKTLKNHLILYDAECPMCSLYTRAFTTTGMLDPNGRAPYQDMPEFACPLVHRQRSVDEIALIDKTTGEVRYGIDSLFAIIGSSFPIFKPLFANKAFHWAMRKLYALISYNRKVIIPAPKTATPGIQPTFKLPYRLAWLLFSAMIAGGVLTAYTKLLTGWVPTGNPWREYAICGGQILFQGAIVTTIAPSKKWDYLGNMMTISLAGALLLLPMLAATTLIHLSPLIPAAYFVLVVALMLLEHLRRTKLLSFNRTLTITWIAYRAALLLLIEIA